MEATIDNRIMPMDRVFLEQVAREASGCDDLELQDYHIDLVSGGFESAVCVQRVEGTGITRAKSIPWKMIVKTYFAQPGNDRPKGFHYWKREASYYASGQLAKLPPGLRSPRCYAVCSQSDQMQVLIEDLSDQSFVPGTAWTLEDYGVAARCLGRFNGGYLTGHYSLPVSEWVPSNWLQDALAAAEPNVGLFFRTTDQPILNRAFDSLPRSILQAAWEARHQVLQRLESLPHTFCHQDAFCRNLFSEQAPDGTRLVGVDWSYAGIAPVGSELAPLAAGAMPLLGTIPASEGERLVKLVLEAYLAGLRDAGWQPDEDEVCYAFHASSFLRYPIAAFIGEHLLLLIDERAYPGLEATFQKTVGEIAELMAEWNAWNLARYQESQRLEKVLDKRGNRMQWKAFDGKQQK